MKIRNAKKDDIPSLRNLWKSFFHDSDDYLDLYFKNRFCADLTPVLTKNEEIIGMIHLLPCTLAPDQKSFYWYAVGIRENERGNGYFRDFLKTVLKESQDAGFCNLCIPAPGLAQVYQKYGFIYPYTACDTIYIGSSSSNIAKITDATPEDFFQVNGEQGSTLWDLNSISYAFKENKFCNGKQIKIIYQERDYFAFAIKKEDHYLIDNTNLNIDIVEKIQNEILDYLKCDKIVLRSASQSVNTNIIGLSDSKLVQKNSKITMTLS